MMYSHLGSIVLLITASVVASVGPLKNNHEVLGITRAATFEDIQYAYQKLAQKHTSERTSLQAPEGWFVEIQHAYEAISNRDMQEDALRFLDYWGDVLQIHDDEELRRFSEFQPQGSSRLRMIVVMSSAEEQHFEVFAAATKFAKRVRVGQLCQADALTPKGEIGEFLSSLKLRQHPAVVLFDPITRGMKVRYGLDGIGAEIERLLKGELAPTDKIGALQEFDQDSYSARCASQDGEEAACTTMMLIATGPGLEPRRSDLVQVLRPFMDACRGLQASYPSTPCFWLRSGRAPDWEALLRAKGAPDGDVAVFALLGAEEISMAPANVPKGNTEDFTEWFKTVLEGDPPKQSLGSWPSLPVAVLRHEEPQEDSTSRLIRKIQYHAQCVFMSSCRQMQVELVRYEFQMLLRRRGYETYYVQLMNLDAEMQVAAVGALMLICFIFFALCRKCLCGRRRSKGSEDDIISSMFFLVPVNLKRNAQQQYGIGICSSTAGGLKVTSVDEGGLLHAWNSSQSQMERRIKQGDRIVFASGVKSDKTITATAAKDMVNILRSEEANIIVARSQDDREVQRIVGTCVLDGLTLKDNVVLKQVEGSRVGDFEVAHLSPAVQQWNQAKAAQGACCTQRLEVGDRIVSVNGSVDVQSQDAIGNPNPALLIVRWRSASSISTQRVEVSMEKSNPEDKWGMQIRRRIWEPLQMEVLEVVETGLLTRWNNTPGNRQVFKGDRIVSANGLQELIAITNALHESKLKLEFERWVDSSGGNAAPVAELVAAPLAAGVPPPGPPMMGGVPQAAGVPPPGPAVAAPVPPMMKPAATTAPLALSTAPAAPLAPPVPMAPLPPMAPPTFSAASRAPAPPKLPPAPPVPESSNTPMFVLVVLAAALVLIFGSVQKTAMSSGNAAHPAKVTLAPEMRKYLERIHPELYWEVSTMLLLLGGLMTLLFIRNEVRQSSHILQQLCVSAMASLLLGFGGFFMFAWADVYV